MYSYGTKKGGAGLFVATKRVSKEWRRLSKELFSCFNWVEFDRAVRSLSIRTIRVVRTLEKGGVKIVAVGIVCCLEATGNTHRYKSRNKG